MTTYRGSDLDLRAPQPRVSIVTATREAGHEANGNGSWGHRPPNGSYGPLWVDETLLACCNYAYDSAMANGAAEVRLEHLVHALTRVDAASQVLEQQGIQDAALRRESGQIVASTIPLARPGEVGAPRASAYYTEALQRASERAGRAGIAASVSDLLWAIAQMNPDVPGVALFLKYHGVPRAPERPMMREYVREPTRADVRYSAPRYVSEFGQDYRVAELPAYPRRIDIRDDGTLIDAVARRMEQVESTLRGLQSDLAADRRMLADVIGDLQRELTAQRNDAQVFRTGLREEIAGLGEQLARSGAGAATQPVMDRVTAIEKAVAGGIDDTARHWAVVSERLKSVERAIERDTAMDATALNQRLDVIEQAVRSGEAHSSTWAAVDDRLQMMGRALGAVANETTRISATLADKEPAQINDRLRLIETQVAAQRSEQAELRTYLTGEIKSVERSLVAQPNGGGAVQALVNERFQTLGRMIDVQRGELEVAIRRPLLERISTLEGLLNEQSDRHGTLTATLADALDRLNAMEGLVVAGNQRQSESLQALDTSTGEMHEALIKLGSNQQTLAANQQTLASTFDDWRQERTGDLAVVEGRLNGIEAIARQPAQMLTTLSTEVHAIHRAVLATGRKRSWFKNWLYGTDEVWESSWGGPRTIERNAKPTPAQ